MSSIIDDSSIARLDATGQAQLVRNGEVTPAELLERAIALADRIDPEINAIIHRFDDKARATAVSPDLPDGPFKGVPFLLKDLWPASAGDPLHLGVKGLKEAGYIHPTDSDLVTNYRRAGFVIFGRTNTPELGLSATTEPLAYGATRNPWNIDHGPGGSSGGSAAAVAAGIVPAANASDGGGSIRIPAAMTGLVGLKPSRGRVPMGPLSEEWSRSCQHVVCWTMRDAANILDVSAIATVGDGVVAPNFGRPYATAVTESPGALRIGLLTDNPRLPTHEACAGAAQRAATELEALGHHVEMASPSALFDPQYTTGAPALWGGATALSLQTIAEWLGREITEDDVEPATWLMAQAGKSATALDAAAGHAATAAYRRAVCSWWNDFDLLITPTTASPPPVLGELAPTVDDPMRSAIGSIPYSLYTSPFNVTGQPGISLPLGQTDEGLPVGAQIIAAYGREDLLLQVGAQLELVVNWSANRPPMHA